MKSFINFCITEKDLSYCYKKCHSSNRKEYDDFDISPLTKALKRAFGDTASILAQKGNYLLISLYGEEFTLYHPTLDSKLWFSIYAVDSFYNLLVDHSGEEITWEKALQYAKTNKVFEPFSPIVLPESKFLTVK